MTKSDCGELETDHGERSAMPLSLTWTLRQYRKLGQRTEHEQSVAFYLQLDDGVRETSARRGVGNTIVYHCPPILSASRLYHAWRAENEISPCYVSASCAKPSSSLQKGARRDRTISNEKAPTDSYSCIPLTNPTNTATLSYCKKTLPVFFCSIVLKPMKSTVGVTHMYEPYIILIPICMNPVYNHLPVCI